MASMRPLVSWTDRRLVLTASAGSVQFSKFAMSSALVPASLAAVSKPTNGGVIFRAFSKMQPNTRLAAKRTVQLCAAIKKTKQQPCAAKTTKQLPCAAKRTAPKAEELSTPVAAVPKSTNGAAVPTYAPARVNVTSRSTGEAQSAARALQY